MIGTSLLLVFVTAFIAPLLQRQLGKYTGWLLALVPATLFIVYLGLLTQLHGAEGVEGIWQSTPWIPSLGIAWSFYFDGLSGLFALLVSGFGALIVLYASGYLKNHHHLGRFYLYLLLFMAAMLGLVLSANLITLFIFWELTSITSFFLIGYYHNDLLSRKSAIQALLVTGLGGLVLLVGFVILGQVAGSYDMLTLLTNPASLQEHGSSYYAILVCLAIGAFAKSAQFPFHFWLPNAMAAPTPVSAFLHSATMVKAGVYLLARFYPILAGTAVWMWLLTVVGGITALTAAILALKQHDLKRMLAYSTVMALGILVALLGVGGEKALSAMVVFLLAHSLYKAALFMTAGTIQHEAGSRNLHELAGLWRTLPVTFVALSLAALSMAGLPLAIGFIGKELIYKSLLGVPWLLIPLLLTNVALFASSFLLIVKPFFGTFKAPYAAEKVHEAPLSMWLPPLLLALTGVGVALISLPSWHTLGDGLVQGLLEPATSAISGEAMHVSYHLIPKLDSAFMLSLLTFALGALLYFLWQPVYTWLNKHSARWDIGPARWYAWMLQGVTRAARALTAFTQTGNIHREILIVSSAIFVLLALTILRAVSSPSLPFTLDFSNLAIYDLVIVLVMLAGAFTTVLAHRRLTAITALGATGAMVALTYTTFGAPDLAITQFMIETLTVVIIALVMVRLPSFELTEGGRIGKHKRVRDAIIATGVGVSIMVVMWLVMSVPLDMSLSEYFAEKSVPKGKGHNIVNVILVDFRGIDTMGEITVLSVAALGVYALLQRHNKGSRKDDALEDES